MQALEVEQNEYVYLLGSNRRRLSFDGTFVMEDGVPLEADLIPIGTHANTLISAALLPLKPLNRRLRDSRIDSSDSPFQADQGVITELLNTVFSRKLQSRDSENKSKNWLTRDDVEKMLNRALINRGDYFGNHSEKLDGVIRYVLKRTFERRIDILNAATSESVKDFSSTVKVFEEVIQTLFDEEWLRENKTRLYLYIAQQRPRD